MCELPHFDPSRLESGELATHRPWPIQVQMKKGAKAEDVRHRCQVCNLVGKIWEDDSGAPSFRGGVKEPRRVKIICPHNNCPELYCSLECYHWFHVGHEYFEGPAPGAEDDMMDVDE